MVLFPGSNCDHDTLHVVGNVVGQEVVPVWYREARLPEGTGKVKVLWGWAYLVKASFNEAIIANIDAGIYRHASIGFKASELKPVKGPYDNILYWEYIPPGEALEGSIVWLGAQPGATAQKASGEEPPDSGTDGDKKTQGGGEMKEFLKKLAQLFPGKTFSEDNTLEEIKAAVEDRIKAETTKAVDVATAPLNEKIKDLQPLADEGKAYREGMVQDYVTLKAKLGEVSEKPEDQEAVKKVCAGYPLDFLKAEVRHLQGRVEEKFPAGSQTKGDDRRDKSGDGGKKNPLVPEDKEDK
jgi:hypothetical protein